MNIDDLLKEESLEEIKNIQYPTKNQKIVKEYPKGTYIFENNEQFKGIIKNKKLTIGIYKWPNGQQYLGDLSENNNFTKRGTIIFPNGNKLIGYFLMKENKIKSAIYETQTLKYEGSFVNNKLDGRIIIKNKENSPHYFFKGTYSNGKKEGNFVLETVVIEKILQITGTFKKEKKNGYFRVYKISKDNNKNLIYEKYFINDRIPVRDEDKIENKKVLKECESPYKINCLIVKKDPDDQIYILIGSYKNLIIFNINNINTPYPILIFKKENINDILQTKDGKLLLCSSENNFKLIELLSLGNEEEKSGSDSDTKSKSKANEEEIRVIQEFKGLKSSKCTFVMKELSNGLIASGDCENLILWGKSGGDKFYEYKMITHINLSHTYCILEIINNKKENNKNIILSVAQPDSKSVLFLDINNNQINLIKNIENVKTIINRKNIMKQEDGLLYIGCQDSIIIINLNKYEILSNVFLDKITYINFYNKFVLCGILKNINQYKYEGYLAQIQLEWDKKQLNKVNAITVSKYTKKHNGSIIDGCLLQSKDNQDIIITIGNDNKILILE